MPRPIATGSRAIGSDHSAPLIADTASSPGRASIIVTRYRQAVGLAGSRSRGRGYVAESTIVDGKRITVAGATDLSVGDREVNNPLPYSGGRGEP
ncbi:hypothetical protein GCM10027598_00440 [Amycolatopsis oliviviridis]|uniref:Uncharacterized protein n=1 Tax=Amycolatopsis oliviviridis TaxID=1471590 RepID=A0ABQ3LQ42_9PSEU|nr:hypothetical protein GCM10017790_45430 [Amycolatopsis oliviviridis]